MCSMGEFSQSGASQQSGTESGGIDWFRYATERNVDLGFSHYRDGVHHMGVTVPQRCFRDVSTSRLGLCMSRPIEQPTMPSPAKPPLLVMQTQGILEVTFNVTIDGAYELASAG